MKYLIIILLLPLVSNAQLPAGQYLKVKEDGTGLIYRHGNSTTNRQRDIITT